MPITFNALHGFLSRFACGFLRGGPCVDEGFQRHGFGDVKSLPHVATHGFQGIPLFLRFNAFCYHGHPQFMGYRDNGLA